MTGAVAPDVPVYGIGDKMEAQLTYIIAAVAAWITLAYMARLEARA